MDASGSRDRAIAAGEPDVAPARAQEDADQDARSAKWRADNAAAMAAYNAWFDKEGHRYLRDPLF